MEMPTQKATVKSKNGVSSISSLLKSQKTEINKITPGQNENSANEISKDNITKKQFSEEISKKGLTYVDLGYKNINSELLKMINQKCCHLNLSGINLLASNIPNITELRTLALENCGLKSLNKFPKLKNLRYLSLANNMLENLNGLKILKNIERIDIRNNKVEFPASLVLNALGSIVINQYNGEDVKEEDYKQAFMYSPIVGYALRNGRPINSGQLTEENFSIEFLTKKLRDFMNSCHVKVISKLDIKQKDDDFMVLCPYKADSIKWFMHDIANDSEWSEIPMENKSVLPLTMMMRMRLLKCQFTFDGVQYELYTDQPIGRDNNELCFPYPIVPQVDSVPCECSIISLLPLEIPAKIAWTIEENTIAKDVSSIEITSDMIDKELTCLIKPYSKMFPNLSFETLFAVSEKVLPLYPTVNGIEFPGEIIEYDQIAFEYSFSPSHEGESVIVVEKARFQYENWIPVETLKPGNLKYTPSSDTVGFYLRISYTPVTDTGVTGDTFYFYSDSRVNPSIPAFIEPFIAGIPQTYYPLVACAQYVGGKKGQCTYTWYSSEEQIEPSEKTLSKAKKIHEGQIYIPTDDDFETYLYVAMLPVRDDECCGDIVCTGLDSPIAIAQPPQTVECPDAVYTNSKITFEEIFGFYVSDANSENGFALVKNGTSYTPSKDYIGKILRVANRNCDAILGEILPLAPKITELSLDPIQYGIVKINLKAKNVKVDKIEVVWFRDIGSKQKAIGIDVPDYVLTPEDVTYSIYAVVTIYDDYHIPIIRQETERTPIIKKCDLLLPEIVGSMIEGTEISVYSPLEVKSVIWYRTGNCNTMMEEVSRENTYTLTAKDVNCLMKANVTVVHNNSGEKSEANTSTIMCTADELVRMYFPAVHVSIPNDVTEGSFIRPDVQATGGIIKYKKFLFSWDRKIDGEIIHLSNYKDYTVDTKDIGSILQFSTAPLGSDGETQGPITMVEVGPIPPHEPMVTKVKVKQIENGKLEITGKYFGGSEKGSFFEWFVIDDDNNKLLLGKTTDNIIVPIPRLFSRQVGCIYHPVRDDGKQGKAVSSPTIIVTPTPFIESAMILVKGGKLISGSLLKCKATTYNSSKVEYTWKQSNDQKKWNVIPKANGIEFMPTNEQIGKYIMCSIVAFSKNGWMSQEFEAFTEYTIGDGTGFIIMCDKNKDISTVGTVIYTNEKEITWNIFKKGELIGQYEGDEYLLTADNVGQVLCARTKAGLTSNKTEEVHLNSIVSVLAKTAARAGTFSFMAESSIGNISWNCIFNADGIWLQSKKGTVKEGKWKTLKLNCVEQSSDLLEIWLDQSSKYILKPNIHIEKRNADSIKESDIRDYVVSCVRSLAEKYIK